jgi:hypothetical protein
MRSRAALESSISRPFPSLYESLSLPRGFHVFGPIIPAGGFIL